MIQRDLRTAGSTGRGGDGKRRPRPLQRMAAGLGLGFARLIGVTLMAAGLWVGSVRAQVSAGTQPSAAGSAGARPSPSAADGDGSSVAGAASDPAAGQASGADAGASTNAGASMDAAAGVNGQASGADATAGSGILPPSAAASLAMPPDAAPPHRLSWNPAWPHFRPIGYVLTAASVAGALAVTFLIDYPDEPRWSGGILFDDAARRLLRARSLSVRSAIRTASDITLAASLIQTGLIDGALVPLFDHNPGIAAQLTLINAQAFSVNILVATLLFKAVARTRPLVADCERDPNFDPLCNSGPYASFPSSHTSTTFTAAGLTCVHHAYLPLYGGPWDLSACVESIAVATATGLFRVIGDRHYVTDVLFGAAIGFSIGYIYPWLFHYRYGKLDPAPAAASVGIVPVPPYGLGMLGQF
jgi:membrane-associated phospholipid phosphatase